MIARRAGAGLITGGHVAFTAPFEVRYAGDGRSRPVRPGGDQGQSAAGAKATTRSRGHRQATPRREIPAVMRRRKTGAVGRGYQRSCG